jgi:hypothetical protein
MIADSYIDKIRVIMYVIERSNFMENDKKNPFREFAEKANEIRKRPLSPKAITEINDLSKEVEKEESEKEQPADDRRIARKPLDAGI